jgi:hypothetical protein
VSFARTRSRLARIEKTVGAVCPACAGRAEIPGVLFLNDGVLLNGRGEPVPEQVLDPCRVCGKGGAGKVIAGADPLAVTGVRVIAGADPACV